MCTCLVAGDGRGVGVYQVVIDARTLLHELSLGSVDRPPVVVSTQSSERPGCILKLHTIEGATADDLAALHVYDAATLLNESESYAMERRAGEPHSLDHRQSGDFEDTFYACLLSHGAPRLSMWRVEIAGKARGGMDVRSTRVFDGSASRETDRV